LTLLAWLGEDTVGIGVIDQVDPWTYLLTQFRVFGTYVRLLLVPYPQSLEYDFAAVDSVWRLGFLAGLAGVAGLIAGGVGLRRRRGSGWAGIGLLAFLVLLAPTSSIIPSRDFAFEHRLYLPLLGVVVFLAVMAARLPRRTAVLALLLVVWGSLAVNRGRAWSADVTLWEDTVDKAPNKVRAWFNLGGAYLAAGDPRAREAFLRVLELDPGSAEAAYNLGIVEHRSGNLVEALAWYERALGQSPGYWPAHNNIGNARALLGDHAGSAEAYLRTLDLNPDYWPAQFNLALAYSAMNRPDQAVPRLRTVLDWEPDFDEARALLALSLVRLGRTGEADEETRRLGAMPESILIDGNPAPLTAPN
jgi:tetratricopeptide (TPR) repeat protein